MKRSQILEEAEKWIGTPWEHQGRSKAGCDCAGYIYCLGINSGCDPKGLSENPTYGRDPDDTMERILDKHLKRKPWNQRLPASVLFFAFGKRGQHLGLMSSNGYTFYHGYEWENKVVETRLDNRWLKRLRGVYDFYEVED